MKCGETKHVTSSERKEDKESQDQYRFESFLADHSDFDGKFTDFLNEKYKDGWEYEDCQFAPEGTAIRAFCLFERD